MNKRKSNFNPITPPPGAEELQFQRYAHREPLEDETLAAPVLSTAFFHHKFGDKTLSWELQMELQAAGNVLRNT